MGESARRRLINVRHIFVQEHRGSPHLNARDQFRSYRAAWGRPVDIWGTCLATRRTPLLLRGSSVTERLRVAGNADWQEKRVPRCWPSVNCGTSGLECGAGKPPPLYCHVLHAEVSVAVSTIPLNAS
jgi:hypothetical protein